jgi:RND family efflux transporter MFP subunit
VVLYQIIPVLLYMNALNRLYTWYGKRTVLISVAIIAALLIAGFIINFFASNKQVAEEATEKLSVVTLSRVDALSGKSLFTVVGEVKAVSEARLQTETGGRITRVNVALGDLVQAGTIIASVENSAQSAAVLQAQGAYEAAVASAVSSQSSTQSAQTGLESTLTSAVNTYKSAFISADSAVRNTIDDLFTDPTGGILGFRLEAFGMAPALNAERTALEGALDAWSLDVQNTDTHNIKARLSSALSDAERIASYTETIAQIIARQDINTAFTQTQKDTLEAEFLGIRSSLNNTTQSLEGALTAIENAQETLQRAQIAGTGAGVSLSEAQVKSALGTLRAAQSSYEKTIVRTPISGFINALYVKAGEYATPGAPAAVIANNNALEISTALDAKDAALVTTGQEVTIDNTARGIVTAIAPAIDPLSGKVGIKIGVEEDTMLTNGSTVSVRFERSEESVFSAIVVPLSALKITTSGPLAFTVSDEQTLVANPVTLGKVKGDMVEVQDGLTADMVIVVDARGLKEGEKVEVKN